MKSTMGVLAAIAVVAVVAWLVTRSEVAPTELRVAAAEDLKPALDELVELFQGGHPEIAPTIVYAPSESFFAQIEQGAPYDLFLSADVDPARKLVAEHPIGRKTESVFAIGRLAVWVRNESPVDVSRGLAALVDPAIRRVAAAEPRRDPYGAAAEAALAKHDLAPALGARLTTIESVGLVVELLAAGEADAGLVPLPLALASPLRERGKHAVVPAEDHPPITHAGVVLAKASDPAAGSRFRELLREPRGQEILRRHGFEIPAAAAQ